MQFDVDSVPTGADLLDAIKELSEIHSFKNYRGSLGGGIDRNKTIKYIILMYSHDSIFIKKPPLTLEERQLRSAALAGFEQKKTSGEFEDAVVEKLFYLQDEEILAMIVEYLYYQKKALFTEIVTCEHELLEFTRLRMKPVDNVVVKKGRVENTSTLSDKDIIAGAEKKDKLWQGCQNRTKYLKECYAEFFLGEEGLRQKIERVKPVSFESLAKTGL